MSDINTTPIESNVLFTFANERAREWARESIPAGVWLTNYQLLLDIRVAEFIVDHARTEGLTVNIET